MGVRLVSMIASFSSGSHLEYVQQGEHVSPPLAQFLSQEAQTLLRATQPRARGHSSSFSSLNATNK